ncbi:MAG: hypothetical protein ACOVLE_07000 [Pirellula staleyi]
MVWHSNLIHHEISLKRKRIAANRTGSLRIELRIHSVASAGIQVD